MSSNSKHFSIIICTRNRADEVANCLPLVAEQAKEFDDVEVIVVDNGSSDNTNEVVAKLSAALSYPFRYVYEPVAGLCQARNRGRSEARGKVLAYLDDDVIIGEEWVTRVRRHFLDEKSDCLGGKVTATLIGEPPFPVDESMLWFFQATAFGEKPRELVYPEHPIGCNMAFRTVVFDAIGGFDTSLKLYGDETDFFRRASDAGFSIWYDPQMLVDQTIPADRLTRQEIKSKSFKWGQGSATVWMKHSSNALRRFAKTVEFGFRTCYLWGRSSLDPSFGKYFTYWYNRGYLSKLVEGLGG